MRLSSLPQFSIVEEDSFSYMYQAVIEFTVEFVSENNYFILDHWEKVLIYNRPALCVVLGWLEQ